MGLVVGCASGKHEAKRAVSSVYKTDLEKDIVSDTSGDFRKLMVALAKVGLSVSPSLFASFHGRHSSFFTGEGIN